MCPISLWSGAHVRVPWRTRLACQVGGAARPVERNPLNSAFLRRSRNHRTHAAPCSPAHLTVASNSVFEDLGAWLTAQIPTRHCTGSVVARAFARLRSTLQPSLLRYLRRAGGEERRRGRAVTVQHALVPPGQLAVVHPSPHLVGVAYVRVHGFRVPLGGAGVGGGICRRVHANERIQSRQVTLPPPRWDSVFNWKWHHLILASGLV